VEKPVEFGEYQGYKNFASWSVVYWIRQQSPESQQHYRTLAKTFAHTTFQKDMTGALGSFLKGWGPLDGMEANMVRDLLACGIRAIEWDLVYDLLQGKEIKWVPNQLTVAATTMISQAPWRDVLENVEFDLEANSRLRDWTRGQVDIWINNVTARYSQTPLSIFVLKTYEVVLSSVNWEQVVKELKK
jgi:hypothetical protein